MEWFFKCYDNVTLPYVNVFVKFVLCIFWTSLIIFEEILFLTSFSYIFVAYLKKGSDNIIVVDWSDFAWGNYVDVASKTRNISESIAKALERLVNLGLDAEKIHVIGHSLGAHIAGFMGSYLNFQIPRVTGKFQFIIHLNFLVIKNFIFRSRSSQPVVLSIRNWAHKWNKW